MVTAVTLKSPTVPLEVQQPLFGVDDRLEGVEQVAEPNVGFDLHLARRWSTGRPEPADIAFHPRGATMNSPSSLIRRSIVPPGVNSRSTRALLGTAAHQVGSTRTCTAYLSSGFVERASAMAGGLTLPVPFSPSSTRHGRLAGPAVSASQPWLPARPTPAGGLSRTPAARPPGSASLSPRWQGSELVFSIAWKFLMSTRVMAVAGMTSSRWRSARAPGEVAVVLSGTSVRTSTWGSSARQRAAGRIAPGRSAPSWPGGPVQAGFTAIRGASSWSTMRWCLVRVSPPPATRRAATA